MTYSNHITFNSKRKELTNSIYCSRWWTNAYTTWA